MNEWFYENNICVTKLRLAMLDCKKGKQLKPNQKKTLEEGVIALTQLLDISNFLHKGLKRDGWYSEGGWESYGFVSDIAKEMIHTELKHHEGKKYFDYPSFFEYLHKALTSVEGGKRDEKVMVFEDFLNKLEQKLERMPFPYIKRLHVGVAAVA